MIPKLSAAHHDVRSIVCISNINNVKSIYRGADKSLARPGRKQARKHVRDTRDFNNIEMQTVIKFFFFLQGKAPKEIHVILTETLACFFLGRANDLSAPLYCAHCHSVIRYGTVP